MLHYKYPYRLVIQEWYSILSPSPEWIVVQYNRPTPCPLGIAHMSNKYLHIEQALSKKRNYKWYFLLRLFGLPLRLFLFFEVSNLDRKSTRLNSSHVRIS